MIWLVSLLTAAALLYLLAYPFFDKGSPKILLDPGQQDSHRARLRDDKGRLLLAIKELDFDYETGKLSAADYKAIREKYEGQAVKVLKKLGEVEEKWKDAQGKIDEALRVRLGFSPATPQGDLKPTVPPTPTVAGDAMAPCTRCQHGLAPTDLFCGNCGTPVAPACPKCGKTIEGSNRFCPACGAEKGVAAHA